MQEIAIILSSLAGVATAAIARRIPKEKNQAGKTVLNSRVKSQITSLQVERDILNKIITRLYKDNPDISNAQKDRLLSKYQYQLKIVSEKLDRLEQAREHPDFNLVSDSLAKMMDQRLSKLDDRLDEISAKMQTTSKQEMPEIKQDVTRTGEDSAEKQKLKDGEIKRDTDEKPKESTELKESKSLKNAIPQSKSSQTVIDEPKVDSQRKVETSVTAMAPAKTSVVAATPTATVAAPTQVTTPVSTPAPAQVSAPVSAPTPVSAPVLPKADNQRKVETLSEVENTKKSALPIEMQIDKKVPTQDTDDKTQIMQTMMQKPESQIGKTPTPVTMPKPATVVKPDKTATTTESFLGEPPSTTDVKLDDDDDGDMENLDEIKKDIADIMTKLDQAEVE